jgi:single-strand DNA-binding protein
MNNNNFFTCDGCIVRDAELSYTPGGLAILKFSIAVNRSWKKGDEWQEEVSYFDCVMFGKRAENTNLNKGDSVVLTGKLKQERWQAEGKNRSKVVITVDTVKPLVKYKKAEPAPADEEDDLPF